MRRSGMDRSSSRGGGHEDQGVANAQTSIYSLSGSPSGPWIVADDMTYGRWYPTCTSLPDGRVLAIRGTTAPVSQGGVAVVFHEIYDPITDRWNPSPVPLPGAINKAYPFMFLLPDDGTGQTKVFYAGGGTNVNTYILNIADGSWGPPIPSNFSNLRGSAVMYEPGKVLKCGGTAADRTDVIDLNVGMAWGEVGAMQQERWEHNLVLLPDGMILAIGGEKEDPPGSGNFEPVFTAESFDPDPDVEAWTELAAMCIPRARHSTAMLLSDATVLVCGGDDHDDYINLDCPAVPGSGKSAEIFSPPYLFQGPRPVIGSAPRGIFYGTEFKVQMTQSGTQPIDKVTLLRLGAVTHRFDHNQRFVKLELVAQVGSGVKVKAPANSREMPPGYHMLFLVSEDGVPSEARYVLLQYQVGP